MTNTDLDFRKYVLSFFSFKSKISEYYNLNNSLPKDMSVNLFSKYNSNLIKINIISETISTLEKF